MARRKCAVCGSKKWRKDPSSGLITCSEGHVLQDYRIESRDLEDFGPHALHKRTIKSGRKKKERASKADPNLYHGDRARYHYFQCLQLILRMQVQSLIKMWDLPTEFEIICRDIWALHLSLLPNPPPPEPYLFKHDLNDGSPSQSARGGHGDKPTPAKNIDVDADDNNDKSGSSSSDTEVDDEMVKLLREASETPTSSSSSSSGEEDDDREDKDDKEKTSTASSPPPPPRRTRQKVYHAYEAPVSTISVLMLGCWTLRIPVTYMDFVRAIESYDLVYLDPVRQLPATLVRHLTKHNVHALSPHFAPRPTSVHTLVSRLAKQLYQKYRIFTPEMNVAPLLWRAVRAFEGTPTLYILTKKVAKVLSLPLTLHHSLSPSLERRRAKDPSWHKYDNVPVEVSVACAVVVVLKLAYGLDGISRRPKSRTDPIYALPEMKALLTQISKTEGAEKNSMAGVLSATSDLTALDLNDEQLEDYLDFCEKALFPRADRISDPPIVKEYFPLQGPARDFREDRAQPSFTALPAITTLSPVLAESAETRFPGQGYAVYSSTDILGTVPEDYDVVVQRAASWTGMDERIIHSVTETLERRLVRWWEGVERQNNETSTTLNRALYV